MKTMATDIWQLTAIDLEGGEEEIFLFTNLKAAQDSVTLSYSKVGEIKFVTYDKTNHCTAFLGAATRVAYIDQIVGRSTVIHDHPTHL